LQVVDRERDFALDKAGSSNPARTAMIVTTTTNSVKVNPPSTLRLLSIPD
jgi:hypothetical protein